MISEMDLKYLRCVESTKLLSYFEDVYYRKF